VKKTKSDPKANEWSPAMYLGITNKILNFDEVFKIRRMASQYQLDSREIAFMKRIYPYSRRKIAA